VAIAGGTASATASAGEHLMRPGVERRQLLLGEVPLADVPVKEADRRVDDQRLDAANMRETVEPGVRQRRLRLLRAPDKGRCARLEDAVHQVLRGGRVRQIAGQRREGVLDARRQPRLVQPRVDEQVAAARRPARQPPAQPLHVPPPHCAAHRRQVGRPQRRDSPRVRRQKLGRLQVRQRRPQWRAGVRNQVRIQLRRWWSAIDAGQRLARRVQVCVFLCRVAGRGPRSLAAQAPLQLVFGTVEEEAGQARRRVDALESFPPASAACRELLAAFPLGLPAGAACLELPVLHSRKGMGRGPAESAGYDYLLEEDC
jgi:hypothetical protein